MGKYGNDALSSATVGKDCQHLIMASQTNDKKAVFGYIRQEFSNDCWVNEIIQIIIQYYLNKAGLLYVCGSGKHGKLGIEEYNDKICKNLTICPPFDKFNALDVSAGDCHTLILDIDGQVWSCGWGHSNPIPIDGNDQAESISTPKKLSLIQPAIAVAAGEDHSLILLKDGTVQSCGNGCQGQLGHGNEDCLYIPTTIEALQHIRIIQVAVGESHSACLSDNGELFCFGDNTSGDCGVGKDKEDYILSPTKVSFDKKVTMVSCGAYHTLLITTDHLFYSFGHGAEGQLGHGDEEDKYIPTLIDALKHVKLQSFAAGWYHSICVDVNGTVWSFGINDNGECGSETEMNHQLTPQAIEYFVGNKIKAMGCIAGSNQSCVVSDDGDLYVFGCNDKHQLGLELAQNYFTPTKLPLPQNKAGKNLTVGKVSFGLHRAAMICY